jgi:hypothetical protein
MSSSWMYMHLVFLGLPPHICTFWPLLLFNCTVLRTLRTVAWKQQGLPIILQEPGAVGSSTVLTLVALMIGSSLPGP